MGVRHAGLCCLVFCILECGIGHLQIAAPHCRGSLLVFWGGPCHTPRCTYPQGGGRGEGGRGKAGALAIRWVRAVSEARRAARFGRGGGNECTTMCVKCTCVVHRSSSVAGAPRGHAFCFAVGWQRFMRLLARALLFRRLVCGIAGAGHQTLR